MQRNYNLIEKIFWFTVLSSILFLNISAEPLKAGRNSIYIIAFICILLWVIMYRMLCSMNIAQKDFRVAFNVLSAGLVIILVAMILLRRHAPFIYGLPLAVALLLALLLIFQPQGPIAMLVVLSAFLLGEGFWRIHYADGAKLDFPLQFFNLYYLSVLVILGYYLYRREVSFYEKLKQANEELAKSHEKLKNLDSLKTDFVASVSHELFTPLTSIKNAADLLRRYRGGELCADKEISELLQVIESNGDRQERLIRQLLELSKIEMIGRNARRIRLNLPTVLTKIAGSLKTQADNKNIKVIASLPELLNIWAVEEHLEKIFSNVIENAIKYSPQDSSVEIEARDAKESVEIVVSDHGPGVPSDKALFIFERFARIGPAGKYGKSGMGLGLAIAKELVDIHHGEIRVENRSDGGSSFIISLPKDLRGSNNR